jgi:hypothetical protein
MPRQLSMEAYSVYDFVKPFMTPSDATVLVNAMLKAMIDGRDVSMCCKYFPLFGSLTGDEDLGPLNCTFSQLCSVFRRVLPMSGLMKFLCWICQHNRDFRTDFMNRALSVSETREYMNDVRFAIYDTLAACIVKEKDVGKLQEIVKQLVKSFEPWALGMVAHERQKRFYDSIARYLDNDVDWIRGYVIDLFRKGNFGDLELLIRHILKRDEISDVIQVFEEILEEFLKVPAGRSVPMNLVRPLIFVVDVRRDELADRLRERLGDMKDLGERVGFYAGKLRDLMNWNVKKTTISVLKEGHD